MGAKPGTEPTPTDEIEIPTFEEFLAEAQEKLRTTFAPEAIDQFKIDYDEEVKRLREEEAEKAEFNRSEKLKLEKAGLLTASRKEQLEFLFPENGDEGEEDIENPFK